MELKNSLTIEQVRDIVESLGGEPSLKEGVLICRTICHCGDSHKLYYWDNTHLFRCFTECGESFDIYELIRKIKNCSLSEAKDFILNFFNLSDKNFLKENNKPQKNLTYVKKFVKIKPVGLLKIKKEKKGQKDDSNIYKMKKILFNLPKPLIHPWIQDGISKEVMDYYEICYNPKNNSIIIPHKDIDGNLVGLRERTLIKENEQYGKYKPLQLNKTMYNHPLSEHLYGLYQNKENIQKAGIAFVFESEKAVMQYATMFGQENNLAVAMCGKALSQQQFNLLLSQSIKELVIGIDKDFQEYKSTEYQKIISYLKRIYNNYGKYVTVSFLFDKENLLSYKSSPTDKGREIFLELYQERVKIYERKD